MPNFGTAYRVKRIIKRVSILPFEPKIRGPEFSPTSSSIRKLGLLPYTLSMPNTYSTLDSSKTGSSSRGLHEKEKSRHLCVLWGEKLYNG